jgi:uncharacterized protein
VSYEVDPLLLSDRKTTLCKNGVRYLPLNDNHPIGGRSDHPIQPVNPGFELRSSPPDPAWAVWDVVVIAGIFVLAMILSMAVLFTVARRYVDELAKSGELASNPLISVPLQLVAYLLTFAFARVYLSGRSEKPFWSAVKWNLPSTAMITKLLGLGGVLALAIQFASALLPVPKNLPVEQYFRSADSIWLLAVFGTLVAPLAEEIFFRGLLYPALRRLFREPESIAGLGILLWFLSAVPFVWVFYRYQRFSRLGIALLVTGLIILLLAKMVRLRSQPVERWNVWMAIVFTALPFALLHQGQLARAWVPLLMLFLVGLVLTTVRAMLHSLAASWIVHSAYNGTLFILLYLGTSGFRNLERMSQ